MTWHKTRNNTSMIAVVVTASFVGAFTATLLSARPQPQPCPVPYEIGLILENQAIMYDEARRRGAVFDNAVYIMEEVRNGE